DPYISQVSDLVNALSFLHHRKQRWLSAPKTSNRSLTGCRRLVGGSHREDLQEAQGFVGAVISFVVAFAGFCLHVCTFCVAAASWKAAVGHCLVGHLVLRGLLRSDRPCCYYVLYIRSDFTK
ncbi:hypothetical protein Tsubulata_006719, partial [Turnera subulata]